MEKKTRTPNTKERKGWDAQKKTFLPYLFLHTP